MIFVNDKRFASPFLVHATTTLYDTYGRQVGTKDALTFVTTSVLDSTGRQIALKDASGNITTFVYDALDRVIAQTDPHNFTATYAYDAVGRQLSVTDYAGRRIDYAYDALGRKLGETWVAADGTTVTNLATFTYDAAGNQLTAANYNGTYTLTYDALNRVTSVVQPSGVTLTMVYDAAGRRTRLQDSLGGITTSVYDALGQLTSRRYDNGSTELRIDQVYDAAGQLTQRTQYADLAGTAEVAQTDYTYNAAGQVRTLNSTTADSTVIQTTYTYDTAGQLTEELRNGVSVSYGNDATGQLTNNNGETLTYDGTGNRTNDDNDTGLGNQLTSDGTWDFTYDEAGNITKKVNQDSGVTWEYSYDNKNELTLAQKYSADPELGGSPTLLLEAEYRYDAWGNRIAKEVDSDGEGVLTPATMLFALDGWNPAHAGNIGNSAFHVLADLDGTGSLTTRYLHGDAIDELVARIEVDGTETPYFYLLDRQNSIRDVVADDGTVVDSIVYDGFGNITSESNASYRGRYAWTGRELDTETGLQYNRARYYDATMGRWISQDPLGFDAGDGNLYRYVNNAPSMAIDPSGLELIVPAYYADALQKYILEKLDIATVRFDSSFELSKEISRDAKADRRLTYLAIKTSDLSKIRRPVEPWNLQIYNALVRSGTCEQSDANYIVQNMHSSFNYDEKTGKIVATRGSALGSGRGFHAYELSYKQRQFLFTANRAGYGNANGGIRPDMIPSSLPGKWLVSIASNRSFPYHAFIRYTSNATREVCTASYYSAISFSDVGEGGCTGSFKWNADLLSKDAYCHSREIQSPKIYTETPRMLFQYVNLGSGPSFAITEAFSSLGVVPGVVGWLPLYGSRTYNPASMNCATYARAVWYTYTGDYLADYGPFGWIGVDNPLDLQNQIRQKSQ